MSPNIATGGANDDIIVPTPKDDGTLAQARCVAPWDMDFEFNDQYLALELPGPHGVGQTFYIKTRDPVPAATYRSGTSLSTAFRKTCLVQLK